MTGRPRIHMLFLEKDYPGDTPIAGEQLHNMLVNKHVVYQKYQQKKPSVGRNPHSDFIAHSLRFATHHDSPGTTGIVKINRDFCAGISFSKYVRTYIHCDTETLAKRVRVGLIIEQSIRNYIVANHVYGSPVCDNIKAEDTDTHIGLNDANMNPVHLPSSSDSNHYHFGAISNLSNISVFPLVR